MDALQDEILKIFGEHVKDLRFKFGLTQDDVLLNSSKITKGTATYMEKETLHLLY